MARAELTVRFGLGGSLTSPAKVKPEGCSSNEDSLAVLTGQGGEALVSLEQARGESLPMVGLQAKKQRGRWKCAEERAAAAAAVLGWMTAGLRRTRLAPEGDSRTVYALSFRYVCCT